MDIEKQNPNYTSMSYTVKLSVFEGILGKFCLTFGLCEDSIPE